MNMSTIRLALVFLLALPTVNQAAQNAKEMLAASDAIRNPDKPFRVNVVLSEYRSGKLSDQATLVVLSRADPHSGQFRNLISYQTPPQDAGKLLLQNGTDLWYFDPSSRASLRISPQQRLLGQAANGDVVTVNLARDYHVNLAAEEDVKDGNLDLQHCYRLDLDAAEPGVTYARIEMWVRQADDRPVRARFYSESGHLLKTAYYRRYQGELGTDRPTETVIIDGLDPNWVTIMRYSKFAWEDIPESWLQRDYLPNFRLR